LSCGFGRTGSNGRFGSKADMAAHSSDVRFTPKSGHYAPQQELVLFDHLVGGGDRLLKLDHVDAGQRDLVNDRTRQSVSCNLVFIGVVARHSIHRYDHVKTTQRCVD